MGKDKQRYFIITVTHLPSVHIYSYFEDHIDG